MKTLARTLLIITFITFASGCDFFGKKTEDVTTQAVGQLSNGSSILGTWTFNYASTATTRNPSIAYNETYIFDPAGSVRLTLKDLHKNGLECIGYGQYRIIGQDVFVYIQAVNDSVRCAFAAVIQMTKVKITNSTLTFYEPSVAADFTYFSIQLSNTGIPTGLWDFHGAGADAKGDGGIDWILFDDKGFFVLQTEFDKELYLLIGTYAIGTDGSLTMHFFTDDPDAPTGDPMIYKQMLTDGLSLSLIYDNGNGATASYLGSIL